MTIPLDPVRIHIQKINYRLQRLFIRIKQQLKMRRVAII